MLFSERESSLLVHSCPEEGDMQELANQLLKQYPDRAGEFTGWYEVEVACCDNPDVDAIPSQRSMMRTYTNLEETPAAIKAWAEHKVQSHLADHQKMGTTPCRPIVGEVTAIYQSLDGINVVRLPFELIRGALDAT